MIRRRKLFAAAFVEMWKSLDPFESPSDVAVLVVVALGCFGTTASQERPAGAVFILAPSSNAAHSHSPAFVFSCNCLNSFFFLEHIFRRRES